MKKFVTLLFIIACAASTAEAQTFLEHLQKKEPGKASVKVSQSKEIDELVNGKAKTNTKTATPAPTTAQKPKEEEPRKQDTDGKTEEKEQPTEEKNTDELEIPTLDLRKKVMRRSYKTSGYRVQVYAGGNSRTDRQKAESIRDDIKQSLPNEPIYVHFYSPRWICRVGNYRSYEEAAQMLEQVRKLGYKQASIVRGKITVQY